MQLVLASASPRRADLLRQLGLSFTIEEAAVDEELNPRWSPSLQVRVLALRKAVAVARKRPDCLVIGADTLVVMEGKTMGKPVSAAQAEEMLRTLSGRVHEVVTGVAVVSFEQRRAWCTWESTRVFFRLLMEEEIRAYVATGEPMDKAGAYGIQNRGAVFVERIEGCYFNVVGLPLVRLNELLVQAGFRIYNAWEKLQ